LEKTDFQKNDKGKVRFSLIPPKALLEVGKVFTYGANKYEANNWRKIQREEYYRLIDAALRHLNAYMRREEIDSESNLPHLAHSIANLMMLLEKELDDKVRNTTGSSLSSS